METKERIRLIKQTATEKQERYSPANISAPTIEEDMDQFCVAVFGLPENELACEC